MVILYGQYAKPMRTSCCLVVGFQVFNDTYNDLILLTPAMMPSFNYLLPTLGFPTGLTPPTFIFVHVFDQSLTFPCSYHFKCPLLTYHHFEQYLVSPNFLSSSILPRTSTICAYSIFTPAVFCCHTTLRFSFKHCTPLPSLLDIIR